MSLELIIRGGKFNGQIVRVADNVDRFVVGRDPQCDLRITRQDVSREHCLFVIEPDWVILHDLNSSNGTFVNGQPLMGPTPIAKGDQILVGPLVLEASGQVFDRSGSDTLELMLDAGSEETLDVSYPHAQLLRDNSDDGSSVGVGYERPFVWTDAMNTAQTNISRSHPSSIGNKP